MKTQSEQIEKLILFSEILQIPLNLFGIHLQALGSWIRSC